jgi:hypothetical protein
MSRGKLSALLGAALVILVTAPCASAATVVVDWNNAALGEVRLSKSLRNGPPMVARALAITHTCMYDAWAAYDDKAVGTNDPKGKLRRPRGERTDANKAQAISFAAYRCLRNLYPDDGTSQVPTPSARLTAVLSAQGYVPDDSNMDKRTPAGIGNIAAQAVIDARANDGSNQYGSAACPAGNICPTVPVTVYSAVSCVAQTYPWTTATIMQLGNAPAGLQPLPCVGAGGAASGPYADYVTSGYSAYVPSNPLMGFCSPLLSVCPDSDVYLDPSLPWPNVADKNHWQPLIFSSHARQTFTAAQFGRVTPFALTSAAQFDSSIPAPAVLQNDGQYQNNVNQMIQYSADLDTARKLLVEYWADGPNSELPPGHWGLFAQYVSQRDQHTIDDDAKMFFAMHNASFDAGIVAWYTKRKFDGVRPITAVRVTKQGQIIRAWGGPGRPTENIAGEDWMPYNPGTNLTPPFPGYFSGHSVFSRSSATVLNLFTGSDNFGFTTVIPANFGKVEPNIPPVPTTMSFATFNDAANAAGLSRLYGGIHFPDDNTIGQTVGVLIGQQAWAKAQNLFNGNGN